VHNVAVLVQKGIAQAPAEDVQPAGWPPCTGPGPWSYPRPGRSDSRQQARSSPRMTQSRGISDHLPAVIRTAFISTGCMSTTPSQSS
jgi:hypothetical protein